MNQKQIEELRHKRAALVDEMREISDKAETEDRTLTAEEKQEFERRESDFESLTNRVRRAEKLDGFQSTMTRTVALPDETPETDRGEELRAAFDAYTRGQASPEQRSILNTVATGGADGGYAVPEQWGNLIDPLREAGAIRQLATVITTAGAGTMHFPKVAGEASAPLITPEADDTNAGSQGPRTGTIADSAQTFTEVTLGAYKYSRITKASVEMVQDALFNVAQFVSERAAFDVGLVSGAAYAVGVGSTTEPQGLFTGAGAGKTGNLKTAITLDEVIDLVYSVIAPYRRNGVFIMNDTTISAVRKLKDGNGQYHWQPSAQLGEPDRLLGYPVHSDPNVDKITTSAGQKVVGFGDVKRAYLIRDVGGVDIKFLDQTFAETDEVGWRVRLRTDAAVVDSTAFKVLKTGSN